MIQEIENAGLSFVGKDETGRRMEVYSCLMFNFSELGTIYHLLMLCFIVLRVWCADCGASKSSILCGCSVSS